MSAIKLSNVRIVYLEENETIDNYTLKFRDGTLTEYETHRNSFTHQDLLEFIPISRWYRERCNLSNFKDDIYPNAITNILQLSDLYIKDNIVYLDKASDKEYLGVKYLLIEYFGLKLSANYTQGFIPKREYPPKREQRILGYTNNDGWTGMQPIYDSNDW